MLGTATDANNMFIVVEQIRIVEIQEQSHGYFGLILIGNVIDPLPMPLTLSSLTHLYCNYIYQSTKNTNLYDGVRSDIIANEI